MHARTRAQSIMNSTRKRTRTQINARKLIFAMDVWSISACKRDCDFTLYLKLSECTYYMCIYIFTKIEIYVRTFIVSFLT